MSRPYYRKQKFANKTGSEFGDPPKYFEQKRREQLNRDSGQGGKQQLRTGTVQQSAQRFTGGGFSLGS